MKCLSAWGRLANSKIIRCIQSNIGKKYLKRTEICKFVPVEGNRNYVFGLRHSIQQAYICSTENCHHAPRPKTDLLQRTIFDRLFASKNTSKVDLLAVIQKHEMYDVAGDLIVIFLKIEMSRTYFI